MAIKGSIIAISGMMGSGKSTLARNLSHYFGWSLLTEEPRSRSYLNDLFDNQKRWAFDTQISFLCEKAIRLKRYVESGQNVILDRSIIEDVEVFASFFYQTGKIDSRSYGTYRELANYFAKEVPFPDLIVFCDCSFAEIESRIEKRRKKSDVFYPESHLFKLFEKYKIWVAGFRNCCLCKINSEKYDFRNTATSRKICDEIRSLLISIEYTSHQLMLPGYGSNTFSSDKPEILNIISPPKKPLPGSKFKKVKKGVHTYPSVYIAAPFTAIASDTEFNNDKQLFFDFDIPHGTIKKGSYRNTLNSISRIFKKWGFSVVLPHRDINQWGKKILLPKNVFKECTKAVKSCDLFIGLLGLSHGSHFEFGLALGQHRPSIVICSENVQQSFIADGIRDDSNNILLIKCNKFESKEISKLLQSNDVMDFLKIYFPMEEL